MSAFRDITGQRFGRLSVVRCIRKGKPICGNGCSLWSCLCLCGKISTVAISNLTNGHTRSCGCIAREIVLARSTTHGEAGRGQQSKEHMCWAGMHRRCSNPNEKSFYRYGGAGIKVCARWCGRNGYKHFLSDMGRCPPEKRSIDRKNGKRGYSKANCRWADNNEQANNTKTNRPIRFRGITMNLCQWARRVGIDHSTLQIRLKVGWSVKRALTAPVRGRVLRNQFPPPDAETGQLAFA